MDRDIFGRCLDRGRRDEQLFGALIDGEYRTGTAGDLIREIDACVEARALAMPVEDFDGEDLSAK